MIAAVQGDLHRFDHFIPLDADSTAVRQFWSYLSPMSARTSADFSNSFLCSISYKSIYNSGFLLISSVTVTFLTTASKFLRWRYIRAAQILLMVAFVFSFISISSIAVL